MKLFDRFKKRKYHDIFKKHGIETVKVDKSKKNEIKFANSLVEENEGRLQLLGEKAGTFYLISNVGTKDIKFKKSFIRHFDLFEKDRICNMFYGVSFSSELKYLSDSLSSELEKGMTEEDILFRKEIMKKILVSTLDIKNDDYGHYTSFTIYAPTDIEEIINFKCDDKRVEKVVRNIGKKLSEMSEEERFILFINCIRTIFETEDEKTIDIVDNAINELAENKLNGKQPDSKIDIIQKEKEDIINFINLSVIEKYKLKKEIESKGGYHNSDITYLISLKTGDKICLSTFPIKDVNYKSNLKKILNNMFNEEKSDFILCSLLDMDTLIDILKYVPNWLYEHDDLKSRRHRLSRGTKGYYATNEIDEKVLNKYNELVMDLKAIETSEDYIEFYSKYMIKLIDYIKNEYGTDDEYQLHLLDQFMEKCYTKILEKSNKIPYLSIASLRPYTKDSLKDIFYKKEKPTKLGNKLTSLIEAKNMEKDRKREEERQKAEKIKQEKDERIKEKMDVISSIIAQKTSFQFKKTMTLDDIKKEILKQSPSFTEKELEDCTRLVLEKSSQILTKNTKKKLGFKWGIK